MDLHDLTFTDADGEQVNAYDFLMKDGDLAVPGGRYGYSTRECADIALMLWLVLLDGCGSDADNEDALNGCMSMVVNSSDEVCWTILDAGHVFRRNDDNSPRWTVRTFDEYPLIPEDYFDEHEIEYARELYEQAYGEPARGW